MENTLLAVDEFITRRDCFFSQMPNHSVALIPAGAEVTRSNDTEYPFCQNKNFYYLTGFHEPDALLVLITEETTKQQQAILFCRAKDPLQEVWHGRRIGQTQAQEVFNFNQCFTLEDIEQLVPEYLQNKKQILFCQGENTAFDQKVLHWLSEVKKLSRQGIKAPSILLDCTAIIHEMRLIKSKAELAIMRKVNRISGLAHQRAMRQTQVGKYEYQIEADILHEFAQHGARYPAYGSIVAGGDNANILHYTDNNDTLKNDDLLLIDAGGELAGYAADITRTFPVNGKFTPAQKTLYQLVLNVQALAINAIKPNATLAQLNALTCDYLTTELHKLGILTGELSQLLADKACKKYFIHGLGHWLGLDVHDVGDYQANDKREQLRLFKPGMVMTIEPGLYIPLNDDSVDEKWRGIGIRIEDNILVTDQDHENLTVNAPKSISEIEALMLED